MYEIDKADVPLGQDSSHPYGERGKGLRLAATQRLPEVDPDLRVPTGEMISDTGYLIHITPYGNTNGCIGIRYVNGNDASKAEAEAKMEQLLLLYNRAIANGEIAYAEIRS
jgi:hypothetical protein